MRSYALYRIASTIHFLLFFFLSLLIFEFSLPDRLIILIAVLNDAATLVISVDNAKISGRRDKWRIGQLLTLSFILGITLTLISWIHFVVAAKAFEVPLDGRSLRVEGADKAGVNKEFKHVVEKLQSVMYLNISSCPHFVIFSTRVPGWFWESMPSLIFIIAVGGTQVIAMVMSIVGWDLFYCAAIGPIWGVGVILSSLFWFVILDFVKVMVIKHWSFEVTATLYPSKSRKAELAKRKARKLVTDRVYGNIDQARNAFRISTALVAMQQKAKKQAL